MEFTVLQYCESQHLSDDLDLRLCKFCRKAMCKKCFDTHKIHCSGQAVSYKRNSNDTSSASRDTQIKKPRTYGQLGQSASSNFSLYQSTSKTTQSTSKNKNTHLHPLCSVHSLAEDQFCITHCKLVCQNCHIENHVTCTVQLLTDLCESLDHTTVTDYKKWVNNLRVSVIQIEKLLNSNLESLEKQKITALNDLQANFSKANENLNHAFLDAKSEIEKAFENYCSENWEKITLIEGMNDKLERSLKDSRPLEGSKMDIELCLKLIDIIYKHGNQVLPAKLKTLSEQLKKVKSLKFVPNIRYQPFSSRSTLGHVQDTITTKVTRVYPASTADLSHIFSKVLNVASACPTAYAERVNLSKTKNTKKTFISGKSTESGFFIEKTDSNESGTIKKDFTAKATGQFAFRYIDEKNNVKNIVLVPSKPLECRRCNIPPSGGNKGDVHRLADTSELSIGYVDANGDVSSHNGSEQSSPPGNTDNDDENREQPPDQSDSQTRSCIQVNVETSTVKKSVEHNDAAYSDTTSNELYVLKPQIDVIKPSTEMRMHNKHDYAKDLLEKPSNTSISSPAIESGAGLNQPHENYTNKNFEATEGCCSSTNQQGNGTTYNNTYNVQQRFEGSEFGKPNIKAVEYSRNSFPRHTILNSQTFEKLGSSNCSKSNDLIMPTNITNPSTEIKEHDNNVSCISNCQATPETASCIVNPPHLIANGEAIDLRPKIYTCSDVGDMNSIFGSTSLVTGRTSDITSNNNHQQHGDSEFSMPSTNKVEYFQNSLSICSGSNIQSIGDSRYDHLNNIDGVKISDTYPSYTYNLVGSSSASVEDKNKSTVLGEHPFEIKNNKKMVFTKLKVKRVSKKNVRLSSDACVDKPSITGCVFMPDERVVLCDYSNRKLRLLDKSFKLEDSLELPSQVWCISVVNDTTVIITLPYKEQLQYIEVSPRLKSGRVLQLDKHCWGVHVVGSDTYVTCFSILNTEFSDRELRILDKDGNLMHSLDMNKNNEFMFKYPDYLAISARSGKIYVSDRGTDTVTCLTSDGTVVFQYEDPELTSSGLCVDDEDNVIVCGSYNTHIVTSDGKKSSVIPTDNDDIEYDNDDIEYPHSIAYRRTDRTLIVGCRDNESLFVVSCAEK